MEGKDFSTQPAYETFIGYLRSALHYLYDPVHLRRSPLVGLLGLVDEFDRATALQNLLIKTIKSLEPGSDDPPQSAAWRVYDTLNLQYIRQFSRATVANQLGMSDRQLRREQRLALEALGQTLWVRVSIPVRAASQPQEETVIPAGNDDQALREELGWLGRSAVDQRISLGEIIQTAAGLAQPLAEKSQVALHIDLGTELVDLPVGQQATQHILLTVLGDVIPKIGPGAVTISAACQKQEIAVHLAFTGSALNPRPLDQDRLELETAGKLASFYGARLETRPQGSDFTVSLSFPAPEQARVLVIDDNADWLEMLKRFAAGTPYQIIGTREPETACALAAKTQPAVIFLDVMMPAIDGWQILSALRHEQTTHQIPIVVCTVLPLEGLALSLGASAFLQKPVRQDQFLTLVEKLV